MGEKEERREQGKRKRKRKHKRQGTKLQVETLCDGEERIATSH